MENFKIIIPLENEEEKDQLRKVAESFNGINSSIGKQKNIDGADIAIFMGQLEHVIEFAGSLASIYAVIVTRRVQIIDSNNNVKNNIKFKDVVTFLSNLIKK